MDPFAGSDPFADLDDQQRTYIKPRPGGRAPARTLVGDEARGVADTPAVVHGLNPLVELANRLLMLAPSIRSTQRIGNVDELRQSLAQGIRDFASAAAAAGITPDRVMAARYVLCTLIDEAASDTPWGGSGLWARHSLLAMFHNETEGGEKVFQLMARLAEKPSTNLDLLELIYCALALGFEGRYRIVDNGAAQLEAIRAKLAQIIRKERGDHAPALAEHWQGQVAVSKKAPGWLPLVATAAIAAVVLALVYAALSFSIERYSDPVYAQIQSLQVAPQAVVLPPPAPTPRLRRFLEDDIRAQTVDVRDLVDRSIVTIRGDGAFATGSATLLREREALMGRIGDAIAQLQGKVLVTGHTDNLKPGRGAVFPSNFALSQARADSVRELLIDHNVAPDRITAEGRSDAEPVQSNDTAAGRAANRRVEITLFAPRLDPVATRAGSAP